jgi:hypothetical protein
MVSATVSFSATPAFPANTASVFDITLTGNVTSSTIPGAAANQFVIFRKEQDATGGRTQA